MGFPDILDHRGVPAGSEDWSFVPFSDHGSWQGFALPPDGRVDLRGAFIGPFLMAEGRWLGTHQAKLSITDAELAQPLPLAEAETFRAFSLPGSLHQQATLGELGLSWSLWFPSGDTALIRVEITNRGAAPRRLDLAWSGAMSVDASPEVAEGRLTIRSSGGALIRIDTDRTSSPIIETPESWTVPLTNTVVLEPVATTTVAVALTLAIEGDPPPSPASIATVLADPGPSYVANVDRWNGYLGDTDTGGNAHDPRQILAVKSVQTLVNNWRGPAGRMRHSSLFPSSNVGYFNGFWAWDSWKHAVGLLRFDPELAQEQVRAMFDHQNESGMVADVVYLDPTEDNWRDTKPPLAGWAIEAIYDATGDQDFVLEIYPKLVAYHRFWYSDRDHDGDGLCEYGSTDGTLVAARWESGMDNAVRFDESEMLQNGPSAWSMDQESVDLNSYLYREKLALERLAHALGRHDEAASWAAEATLLRESIRSSMFDGETGWFYDVDIETGRFVPVQGPEGWTPLWTGVATVEQAARVRDTMLDTDKFATFIPFPTVARDDPGFSEGYWRGLVWLDQVYFAMEALRRYGYEADAEELSRQLFERLEGATEPGAPLFENYHPLTGEGRNVKHFSWTAAHLLQLALDAE